MLEFALGSFRLLEFAGVSTCPSFHLMEFPFAGVSTCWNFGLLEFPLAGVSVSLLALPRAD